MKDTKGLISTASNSDGPLSVRHAAFAELVIRFQEMAFACAYARVVDGIKQPFLIRWSMPGRSWGRKIAELKQNVAMDDAQFNPPSSQP